MITPSRRRRRLAVCVAATTALLLATAAAALAAGPRTSYPLTIRNCGKTLRFEKVPTRALSDQAQDTTPFFALGIQDSLVAIFSHTGSDLGFMGVDPKTIRGIDALPDMSTKTSAYPAFEKVLAARADFIFQAYPDDAIAGNKKNQKALDATGIPVYTETANCEKSPTYESGFTDLLNLGKIFDVQDRAQKVVAEQRALLAKIDTAVKGKKRPRVFLLDAVGSKGEIWTNTSSYVQALVRRAGGTLVPAPGPDRYSTSREALAASNFDLVLVTHYTGDVAKSVGTDRERAEKIFALAPNAPGSKARRWAAVPYPGGPNGVLITKRFAQAIHPGALPG